MKRLKWWVVLATVLALSGCNMAYKNKRGSEFSMGAPECQEYSVVTLAGKEIKCMTEEAMIAYYVSVSKIENTKARMRAIKDAKGDAAAQVLLAFEWHKKDSVTLVKSKTWDERALPYADMLFRVLTGRGGFGIGNSQEAIYLELKGDGNTVNIGNETDVGADYVQTRSSNDYKYIMQSTQSGEGYSGAPVYDFSEKPILAIPEEG